MKSFSKGIGIWWNFDVKFELGVGFRISDEYKILLHHEIVDHLRWEWILAMSPSRLSKIPFKEATNAHVGHFTWQTDILIWKYGLNSVNIPTIINNVFLFIWKTFIWCKSKQNPNRFIYLSSAWYSCICQCQLSWNFLLVLCVWLA